jgi:hypothetical protein
LPHGAASVRLAYEQNRYGFFAQPSESVACDGARRRRDSMRNDGADERAER